MTPARWGVVLVLSGAIFFALQGGEYGTWDLLQLRHDERVAREQVAQLQRTVDSLERAAQAIERDPAVQERVARESFGMLRKGEFLYRIVPAGGPSDSRASLGRRPK